MVYEGPYQLLRRRDMSQAYASVLHICFAVNAGLLIRQIHHWAATFSWPASSLHMGRIFFTGAFRNPRELNWIIGVAAALCGALRRLHRATRCPTTCSAASGW